MEKIIVLYDPDNLVSSFKEKITPVINNRLLLKTRANTSFEVAMTEIANVKKSLSEGALDRALVRMYASGGGSSYSGVVVQVLKTVVKFSGVPPTARRIWLRFKEACHKLNTPDLQKLLEDCYGMDRLDQEKLQEIVGETCLVAKSLIPKVTVNDLERFKLAFTEFMEGGEIGAAYVYILGSLSATYLELGSEGWQKQVRLKLEELLYKTAGFHSQKELGNRVRIILKAMNSVRKEWLN